jgi:hypothetical protein
VLSIFEWPMARQPLAAVIGELVGVIVEVAQAGYCFPEAHPDLSADTGLD